MQLRRYELDLNPKKVNVLGTDCNLIVENAKADAATILSGDEGLNKEQRTCVKKCFMAKQKYFDNLALAIALGSADVTTKVIDEEREKFIVIMNEMTDDCNQCVLKKTEKSS